jgi:hypothetical protein
MEGPQCPHSGPTRCADTPYLFNRKALTALLVSRFVSSARPDLLAGAQPTPGLPSSVPRHHLHPMYGTKLSLRIWIGTMFRCRLIDTSIMQVDCSAWQFASNSTAIIHPAADQIVMDAVEKVSKIGLWVCQV